ncbi:MAG: CHAT domain-containing protein [Acidobacteriota bacterium]
MTTNKTDVEDALIAELGELRDDVARREFLQGQREAYRSEFVVRLAQEVHKTVREDAARALALGQAGLVISEEMEDRRGVAVSLRAKGNALYALEDYRAAVDRYQKAAEVFHQCGDALEVGRTLSTSIQSLILLGEYDRAFTTAEKARRIFSRFGDEKRLARLDINVGNIFHRQDRFPEALARYEQAYQQLLRHNDAEGIEGTAAALSNISGCLIMLNDFGRALEIHRQARRVCEEHHMPRLVAQADYNIAYMYYLRGEYSRSVEMLNAARQVFLKTGDAYHSALCDMDQAEIYLELNLSSEAAHLSRRARSGFASLGTEYERAKSIALEAIALSGRGQAFRSLELFGKARDIFLGEKNQVWPWIIDLYRAMVLYDAGRLFEAHRLCREAVEFFLASNLPTKAVLCHLLLARLSLRIGDLKAAGRACARALDMLRGLNAPVLSYQANFLHGLIEEASGGFPQAFACYRLASDELETLRSSLQREEMKIAFMKNKLEVYEGLVELCLGSDVGLGGKEEAFGYIEQAKSRGLIDLILTSGRGRPSIAVGESELARRVQSLREELNWYYRRIEQEQLGKENFAPERIEELSETALAREKELLAALRELPTSAGRYGGLQSARPLPLTRIQAALGPDRVLLEYYCARDRILVCVVTHDGLEVLPLAVAGRVKRLVQKLQFQLSKFRLASDYVETFKESINTATHAHLRELHEELIAPILPFLSRPHLIIVPHGFTHYLPFHAFFDGHRYLIDDFTVSYAPSASIYVHCHEKGCNGAEGSLILGMPSQTAPFVLEEVQSVAASVARPELLLGTDASIAALREKALHSRLIHIATHGYHRRDNPMFSAIRLGESYLSLYDMYNLKLPVELVTLSACATGLSVVVEGDELLGLVRGLLYAGAQSLLVTLWDVHDRTTASFMRSFYSHLRTNPDKAEALRCAILDQRKQTPQPYFWAPYVLVGKASL